MGDREKKKGETTTQTVSSTGFSKVRTVKLDVWVVEKFDVTKKKPPLCTFEVDPRLTFCFVFFDHVLEQSMAACFMGLMRDFISILVYFYHTFTVSNIFSYGST